MALSEAEKKELASLEQEIGGLSEDELAEMRSLEAQLSESEEDPWETEKDFARGVGSGATFGLLDEMTGAVGGALDPSGLRPMVEEGQEAAGALRQEAAAQDPQVVAQQMKAEGFSDEEIASQLADISKFQEKEGPSTYGVYRDRARGFQEEAAERSPTATNFGELLGAAGSGGLITKASTIPGLAAEGALYGFGGAEGTAGEQLLQTALGAGLGAGFGAAGKQMSKYYDKFKNYLKGAAERQAVSSTKPTVLQGQKIFDEQRMGRELLDQKIPQALRSPAKMYEKAKKAESKLGDTLDDAYEEIGGDGVNRIEVANQILRKAAELKSKATANKPIVQKMRKFAKDFVKQPDSMVPPKRLREERIALDKVTNFNSDAATNQANKALRDIFREAEEEAFSIGGVGKEFIDLKRKFMDMTDAASILKRSSARSKSDNLMDFMKNAGLTGIGGIGYQTDSPWLQAAAALGYAGRKIGRGGSARFLDMLSKTKTRQMAPQLNRLVQSQNPFQISD